MKIVWDEPKRFANLDKHGLDFARLTVEFFEAATVLPAKKNRFQAIGGSADGTIVVIFLALGSEGLSVVSMRPARKDERNLI